MIHIQELDPDVTKDLNVEVFNLLSRTNKVRQIKWHESCKCRCRVGKIICNNKQRQNKDNYRCECKGLIDKGVYKKGYTWNPCNWECECNESCNVGKYLNYSDCKCQKKKEKKRKKKKKKLIHYLLKNVLKILMRQN